MSSTRPEIEQTLIVAPGRPAVAVRPLQVLVGMQSEWKDCDQPGELWKRKEHSDIYVRCVQHNGREIQRCWDTLQLSDKCPT